MTVILLHVLAEVVPGYVRLCCEQLVVLLARNRREPAPLHFFCCRQVVGAEMGLLVGHWAEPVGQLGGSHAVGRIPVAPLRLPPLLVDLLESGGLGR